MCIFPRFLWFIVKDEPSQRKKKISYLRVKTFILRSTGLSLKEIAKKLEKSERWMVKWSSRNEGFEDKKRTGRPKVLNEAAKKVPKKAKYKRGNSTRQLSQQLASKGLLGGKNTVWTFMKSEGWRPLRRQKKPLLTAKQRAARLKFAKQYKIRDRAAYVRVRGLTQSLKCEGGGVDNDSLTRNFCPL